LVLLSAGGDVTGCGSNLGGSRDCASATCAPARYTTVLNPTIVLLTASSPWMKSTAVKSSTSRASRSTLRLARPYGALPLPFPDRGPHLVSPR
jgi:hypothetical protein